MMNRPETPPLSSRPPLEDTTNSPHSRTPSPSSPPYHAAKSSLPKLRRKLSLRALHSNLDSSEEIPSAHSSIYEASLVPSTEDIPTPNIGIDTISGEWDSSSAELKKPPKRRLSPRKSHAAPPSASTTTTRRNLNIHYPHFLETITEQRSIATLRSSLSLKSIRKQSFSVPNLPLPSITSPPASPEPTPLDTIHPPKHPINPPPHRSPTPTGLPTFNTPEAANYRLPPPKLRFRDLFKVMGDEEREWRMQTAGLPRGIVMRGEGGILVRGRWRPPNVGRGWDGHPWTRGQGGSGLGGKREGGAEVGEQQTPAQNSLNLIQESRGRAAEREKDSKWKRFWEGTCFICCGAEKGERGEARMVGERERPEQLEAVRPVITGPFF